PHWLSPRSVHTLTRARTERRERSKTGSGTNDWDAPSTRPVSYPSSVRTWYACWTDDPSGSHQHMDGCCPRPRASPPVTSAHTRAGLVVITYRRFLLDASGPALLILPDGAVPELFQRHRRPLAGGSAGQAVRVLHGGQHQRDAGHDRLVLADVEVDVEEGHEQPGGGEHDARDHRPGDAPDPGYEHDRQQADRGERREAVGRQLALHVAGQRAADAGNERGEPERHQL